MAVQAPSISSVAEKAATTIQAPCVGSVAEKVATTMQANKSFRLRGDQNELMDSHLRDSVVCKCE